MDQEYSLYFLPDTRHSRQPAMGPALRKYARNRVGKITREIVDKDLYGG